MHETILDILASFVGFFLAMTTTQSFSIQILYAVLARRATIANAIMTASVRCRSLLDQSDPVCNRKQIQSALRATLAFWTNREILTAENRCG